MLGKPYGSLVRSVRARARDRWLIIGASHWDCWYVVFALEHRYDKLFGCRKASDYRLRGRKKKDEIKSSQSDMIILS